MYMKEYSPLNCFSLLYSLLYHQVQIFLLFTYPKTKFGKYNPKGGPHLTHSRDSGMVLEYLRVSNIFYPFFPLHPYLPLFELECWSLTFWCCLMSNTRWAMGHSLLLELIYRNEWKQLLWTEAQLCVLFGWHTFAWIKGTLQWRRGFEHSHGAQFCFFLLIHFWCILDMGKG